MSVLGPMVGRTQKQETRRRPGATLGGIDEIDQPSKRRSGRPSALALRAIRALSKAPVEAARSGMEARHATVLGVPSGYGQLKPGLDRGPAEIRRAGLVRVLQDAGSTVKDAGDLDVQDRAGWGISVRGIRNAPQVLDVCRRHAQRLGTVMGRDTVPVSLGGDHSLSLGTLAALQQAERNQGLLWVDAHGDFNTPATSPSGNLHGMVLAQILGVGDPRFVNLLSRGPMAVPDNVVLLGVRSLDNKERRLVEDAGITCLSMREIDVHGMPSVMSQALEILTRGGREFHVSFDIDVMDPAEAPGTGTPVPGGLSYREARVLMETVAATGRMGSLDMTEVNPALDPAGRTPRLAVDLIAAALGRRIP